MILPDMWKSKAQKRKDQFERALSEMVPAATRVAEKWQLFSGTLEFRDGIPLAEQIRAFSFPASEFVRSAYPNISATDPIVYFSTLLIGIYLAKTTPIPELLAASQTIEQETGLNGLTEMLTKFVTSTPNR
jgi:hypothetical protein